jgi:IS5 family transposase
MARLGFGPARWRTINHMDGLSDDAAGAHFVGSPYVQLCCGESHFQHALPLDRSSVTRWRKRISAEQLAAALCAGAASPEHVKRVSIDTTVRPKAVTHPTHSKLLHRGVEVLGRFACRYGIALRQSFIRLSTHARCEVAKLIHRGRHREAERKSAAHLARPASDITGKIDSAAAAVRAVFAAPDRAHRPPAAPAPR